VAKAKARNRRIAEGWEGFPDRLDYAIRERKREWALSQNAIASAAGLDSGQLTKILSGERARGVAANTVLLLAEALKVSPLWLMANVEPSGLGKLAVPHEAPSSPPSSSADDKAKRTA
jgi:transcriptional regulator with XRE-family HTH domain